MSRIAVCLFALLLAACATDPADPPDADMPEGLRFFVGTGGGEGEGVYAFRLDPSSGALTLEHHTEGITGPSFIDLAPDGRTLYAVTRDPDAPEGGPAGAVGAYRIDPETAALTLLGTQPTHGNGPCYVAVDATGRWVLSANYSSGSVALHPVGEDGALGAAADTVQHRGSGPNAERQEGPHAHFFDVDPENRYALAVDLGTDQITAYHFGDGDLQPAAHAAAAPGDGPRHLAFAPSGRHVYVVNELAGSVTAFAYDPASGAMTAIHTVSTLPDDFDGFNKSADIHVHPNGRFLYASNRGDHDSIAVFDIDPETGRLTRVGIQHEGIVWPRNFAVDPTGAFLVVANRNADALAVFAIAPDTGLLTPTGHTAAVPQPMCVKFAP